MIARGARFVLQRLLFQAPGRVPPAELPPGGKLREAVARDRSVASFLHLEAPRSTTTLVYFHGGGTTLSDSLAAGVGLAQRGLSVALVEYRGYGGRPGTPHEAGCYLDGLAVLDALAAEGCGPENVVLCGNSVGAAVALELATQRLGQRLVLLAPFLSARSLVAHWAPFVSADAIAGACFDNLGKAPRVHAATLVIHGERDRLVPPWMGRSLAAAIRGASFVSVPRAGHANLLKRHAGFVLDAIAAHATAG